jgi:hypothetical protein
MELIAELGMSVVLRCDVVCGYESLMLADGDMEPHFKFKKDTVSGLDLPRLEISGCARRRTLV